ncbi:MAG: L28 family ribosomal protein [Candidatus Dojkabacteria bacterium]|uniref:Large ribosomal subunit protein bL28 n=2 Tax=Candidatus Dojkabacteria TaxID=74243 RepID=A0A136KKB9_9BACT|nr:MAG: 50S ribosomal protein L28 [candidate division WS6 bacterium OLB21]MBW7953851.1 50S ribosomal protein L28 [Candidatus Dojkabacteria bacterium]WKZ27941.1 MAG: L28 family ribosomal protein [Candidatus Dojkabacteria bacterium]
MARVCDLTGRRTSTGNHKKHRRGSSGGGGAWSYRSQKVKRTWKPNLRKVKVNMDGKVQVITVSMKAYKTLRNKGKFAGAELVD